MGDSAQMCWCMIVSFVRSLHAGREDRERGCQEDESWGLCCWPQLEDIRSNVRDHSEKKGQCTTQSRW